MHELSYGDSRLELQPISVAMSRSARRSSVICAALLACTAAVAQEAALTGSAALGVRSVNLSGTEAKYREDVNLDDGLRLSGVNLAYAPRETEGALLDRLELDADGLGGDPFESIHFGMRKYGRYKLAIDRRRSEYIYADTILPAELASVSSSTGGDFHRFAFERVRDTATAEVTLRPRTQLSFGAERQTRTGASTTTLALERDEFELARPLDEALHGFTIGLRHAWNRVTLMVDEEQRDFENTNEMFLPSPSSGQNGADAAQLAFFVLDAPYDYTSRGHGVRMLARPTSRVDLTTGWRREDLDLDLRALERSSGVSATGQPFSTARDGGASADRDVEIADLMLGVTINERLRLVGEARRSTLEQRGTLLLAPESGVGAWQLAADGLELGFELAVSTALELAAGWSSESRDLASGWALNAAAAGLEGDTDRTGYFVRALYRPEGGFELTASVEQNSIDDPFALAAPSSSSRYKIGVRYRWQSGLAVIGNYRRTDADNVAASWLADTEQFDVRVTYRRERLELSAGYTRVGLERRADRLVAAGSLQTMFAIDYDTAAMLRDVSARWRVGPRFSIGGDVRTYDTHGSRVLTRDDVRASLAIAAASSNVFELAVRQLDYAEETYDAYDARIVEVSLRRSW
jgi:hypothetical protein